MIKEIWQSFPRLLEEKINGLLDRAEPSTTKAFQLYKTCQQEDLWTDSFDKFKKQLNHFFSITQRDRRKSDIDRILERPMPVALFPEFTLTFHSALIEDHSLIPIASWSHNILRLNIKANPTVIAQDILLKTLRSLTHPPFFSKGVDIKFEDFCEAWGKVLFQLFGNRYDLELKHVMSEIKWLKLQLKKEEDETSPNEKFVYSADFLTQTEIDWTQAVLKAAEENKNIPKFPLSLGPKKQSLKNLERTISLYQIVRTTSLPDLLFHRENIRNTVIHQCHKILNEAS